MSSPGACRRCVEKGTTCVAESVIMCTQCRLDKEWCSMMCRNCMIGHRVCSITIDKELSTCDACKRTGKICIAGPTDPAEIRALRNSGSRANPTGTVNSSQNNGSHSQEKGSGAKPSLAATRSTSASGVDIPRSLRPTTTTIKVEIESNNNEEFEMDSDTEMPPPPTPSQEGSQASSARKRAKKEKKKSIAAEPEIMSANGVVLPPASLVGTLSGKKRIRKPKPTAGMATPSREDAQSSVKKTTAGMATPSRKHAQPGVKKTAIASMSTTSNEYGQSGEMEKATTGNLSTPATEYGRSGEKMKTATGSLSTPSNEHAQIVAKKKSKTALANMFAPSEHPQVVEGFAPVEVFTPVAPVAQMVPGPSTAAFLSVRAAVAAARAREAASNTTSSIQAAVAAARAQEASSQASTSSAAGVTINRPVTPDTAYRRRTYDDRVRIYPFPDDYVPPSLPMMNNPFPMLTTSPKLSPTAPSPATLARLARGPFDDLVPRPIQGPNRVLASLPPDSAFVQTDPEINPMYPPADKPDIESFMCCGNVRYIKQASYTEGATHLIEHFARRGNWYPADWAWISDSAEEATAQWNNNPGYVGLIDLDHVLPGASMHEEADIYGCYDIEKGLLIRIYCPIGRPKICEEEEAKDASKDRFFLVPSNADFFCPVHNKYFHAFWARFYEARKEFVNVDV